MQIDAIVKEKCQLHDRDGQVEMTKHQRFGVLNVQSLMCSMVVGA